MTLDTIIIDEIDFKSMKKVNKSSECLVYFDKEAEIFYKIFPIKSKLMDQLYAGRAQELEQILKSDFCKILCPALTGICYDKGENFRGYVTKKGRVAGYTEFKNILNSKLQPILSKAIVEHKLWYNDLKPENLVIIEETDSAEPQYSFIDFDAIYPIERFSMSKNQSIKMNTYKCKWYFDKCQNIL